MTIKNSTVFATSGLTEDDSKSSRSFPSGFPLHPAWQALIRFCRDVRHGEIERIKIQDGLPVSAEVIRKKIRWC